MSRKSLLRTLLYRNRKRLSFSAHINANSKYPSHFCISHLREKEKYGNAIIIIRVVYLVLVGI